MPCKSVLLELVHLLSEIKDEIVIIGGWTPAFLLPQGDEPHVGSLDIDVALNFSKIPDDTYQTILKACGRSWEDKEQVFISRAYRPCVGRRFSGNFKQRRSGHNKAPGVCKGEGIAGCS